MLKAPMTHAGVPGRCANCDAWIGAKEPVFEHAGAYVCVECNKRLVAMREAVENAVLPWNVRELRIACGILAILVPYLGLHKFLQRAWIAGGVLVLLNPIYFLLLIATRPPPFFGALFVLIFVATAIIGLIEGVFYICRTDIDFHRLNLAGKRPWF